MAAPSLNALHERFAGDGVGSVFLYTSEAHPGEHYPHLTSMEQKYEHAAALRDELDVTRPIYLDALNGACHLAYGSMPNMIWIFNKSTRPIYKSDWSDAKSVENALDYYLELPKRRRTGERLVTFKVERLDYRNRDRDTFYEGLERSGPKAVEEFDKAFGHTFG